MGARACILHVSALVALSSCSPQAQQLEVSAGRVVYTETGRVCVSLYDAHDLPAAVICELADDAIASALDAWQVRLQRMAADAKDAGLPETGYTR